MSAGLLVALAAPPVQASDSTALEYSCVFPLIAAQDVTLTVSADAPDNPAPGETVVVGLDAEIGFSAGTTSGFALVGAKRVETQATVGARVSAPGLDETQGVALAGPDVDVPPSGAFSAGLAGSLTTTFPQEGWGRVDLGSLELAMRLYDENGVAIQLPTGRPDQSFPVACTLKAGQSGRVASIPVGDAGPEPTPTAVPTPTVTATPTLGPTPSPTGSPTTGPGTPTNSPSPTPPDPSWSRVDYTCRYPLINLQDATLFVDASAPANPMPGDPVSINLDTRFHFSGKTTEAFTMIEAERVALRGTVATRLSAPGFDKTQSVALDGPVVAVPVSGSFPAGMTGSLTTTFPQDGWASFDLGTLDLRMTVYDAQGDVIPLPESAPDGSSAVPCTIKPGQITRVHQMPVGNVDNQPAPTPTLEPTPTPTATPTPTGTPTPPTGTPTPSPTYTYVPGPTPVPTPTPAPQAGEPCSPPEMYADGWPEASATTTSGQPVSLEISAGSAPSIMSQPAHGAVTLDGKTATYTPDPGYVGDDTFEWTWSQTVWQQHGDRLVCVSAGGVGRATITVTPAPTPAPQVGEPCSPAEVFDAPLPWIPSWSASTKSGEPVSFPIPAPYAPSISKQPEHGVVALDGKTATYTPDPGFVGSDRFEWTWSRTVWDQRGGRLVCVGSGETGFATITVEPATARHKLALKGSTYVKAANGTLPLTGSIDALVALKTGAFTADVALADTTGQFKVMGFLPVTAKVAFQQVGQTTGTLTGGHLDSTSTMHVNLKSVSMFGLPLGGGAECRTTDPVTVKLASTQDPFNPLSGGPIAGSYSIGRFNDRCGSMGALISQYVAGPGNTVKAQLSPAG